MSRVVAVMQAGCSRRIVVCGLLLLSACQTDVPSMTGTPGPTAPPSTAAQSRPNFQPGATTGADAPVCFEPRESSPFAFDRTGGRLLVRWQGGAEIMDLKRGVRADEILASAPVIQAALSPDGSTLALSLGDNTIEVLDVESKQLRATITGHTEPALDLLFTPDGESLVSATHLGTVVIWSMGGEKTGEVPTGSELVGMGLSPAGDQLATIPFDGPIRLWDLRDGSPIGELEGTGGYDTSEVVYSPDGRFLAADLATGLHLWRVQGGELVWSQVRNSMAISYSPDGEYLAYSDIDAGNLVALATPDGSEVLHKLGTMQAPVWALFFSPDGSRLAASDGVEIRIWEPDTGRLVAIGRSDCG